EKFNLWSGNGTDFLKMCGDSQMKICNSWVESMEELSKKAKNISSEAVPEKYKEFYDEWVKSYQNSFGKYYPLPSQDSGKELLGSLMSQAEESNRLYKSWIAEMDRNSKKTQEAMMGEPSPVKYKECSEMWVTSYEKMFDAFLTLPTMKRVRENIENYTGVPDIYSDNYRQMTKVWKDSYARLCMPLVDSALALSEKAAEISRGKTDPEAYKEFYSMWTKSYQENYSRLVDEQPMELSKETLDNFTQSVNIYLNMYKSWISALEKMSEKSTELSNASTDPESHKEFYDLWTKMYEKAFDNFFEDMPMVGPMKGTMEPVKVAARTYADAYVKMSRMRTKSTFDDARRF
ncbi:MAG: hypothetical protein KJ729_07690, partial [Euryarchaeota archaeon]|nr:hypothetical protein [Euryarchaeota archaeon]